MAAGKGCPQRKLSGDHSAALLLLEDLKAEARKRGLWNLFLPGADGAGLTNLQYAPLAEITGHSPHIAPATLNCAAPDTGNIELLADFGSPAQRKRWLRPCWTARSGQRSR